jgi:hypothetical protein
VIKADLFETACSAFGGSPNKDPTEGGTLLSIEQSSFYYLNKPIQMIID